MFGRNNINTSRTCHVDLHTHNNYNNNNNNNKFVENQDMHEANKGIDTYIIDDLRNDILVGK